MDRHAWTDERIDDMVDRIEADIRGLRGDVRDMRHDIRDLRVEMHTGLAGVRHQMVQLMLAMTGLQMATIVAILVR